MKVAQKLRGVGQMHSTRDCVLRSVLASESRPACLKTMITSRHFSTNNDEGN